MAYINGKEILFSAKVSEGVAQELYDDFVAIMQSGAEDEVTIPEGVTRLRQYAFYRHTITSVTLPNTIDQIFDAAFYLCEKLKSIVFPSGLTAIGKNAFANCSACLVYDFTACKSVPTLANVNVFTGINENAKIKVPKSLYNEWIGATNWSEYEGHIESVVDGIATPSEDSSEGTVSVNTAQYVTMGFYFSDNLRSGTRYVSHEFQGYDRIETIEYELDNASEVLTMNGLWQGDNYSTGGYDVSGLYYNGTITFNKVGTYRIYQKYYDAEGNEYTTGSYVFEVK